MPVTEDAIQFVVRGDGRVTGEAFVSFGSPADSEVRGVYAQWQGLASAMRVLGSVLLVLGLGTCEAFGASRRLSYPVALMLFAGGFLKAAVSRNGTQHFERS